ncbi:MAG: hypothetical protein WHV64_18210, partial [Geminicoccaceae bacterium]
MALDEALREGSAADRPEPAETAPPDATLGAIADTLAEARAAADRDPLANPIQSLACALAERLVAGRLDDAALDRLVRRLTLDAFRSR